MLVVILPELKSNEVTFFLFFIFMGGIEESSLSPELIEKSVCD